MGVDLINLKNKKNSIKLLMRIILLIKLLGNINKVAESNISGNKVIY